MQGCAAGEPGIISCQNTHHPAPIRSPRIQGVRVPCESIEDVAAGRGYAFVQIRMHTTQAGIVCTMQLSEAAMLLPGLASGAPTPLASHTHTSTAAPPNLTMMQRGWASKRPDLRPSGSSWFVLGDRREEVRGLLCFFHPLMTDMSRMAFSVRAGAAFRLLAPELVDIISRWPETAPNFEKAPSPSHPSHRGHHHTHARTHSHTLITHSSSCARTLTHQEAPFVCSFSHMCQYLAHPSGSAVPLPRAGQGIDARVAPAL